jgi:hypothetical protein
MQFSIRDGWSWGSTEVSDLGNGLDIQITVFRFPANVRHLYVLRPVQTVSRDHPVSSQCLTWALSPGMKQPERVGGQVYLPSAELTNK